MRLVAAEGERTVAVEDLYRNDGIDYCTRRPDEILTEIELDPSAGWRSSYWKLRRRGSFDFPVLGVISCSCQSLYLWVAIMYRRRPRLSDSIRRPDSGGPSLDSPILGSQVVFGSPPTSI